MQIVKSPKAITEANFKTGFSLTVIVPVFNEEQTLIAFHHELCKVFAKIRHERIQVIYIDDGSTDNSWQIIKKLACTFAAIERIRLSRNFGKEAAMTAGLDHAQGGAVTIVDADLQDPPELLITMLSTLREGYDVVNMKRRKRHGEGFLKSLLTKAYYHLFHWLSDTPIETDVGDFRMLSRRVVDQIKQLPERNRYMKGIMSWPGYRQTKILFDRPKRLLGSTKWSLFGLISLALSGITAFSVKPLRLSTFAGVLVSLSAFLYGLWVFAKTVLFGDAVAGYPSLMLVLLFIGGVQLLCIGILGEYLGRVFIESKGRPIYLLMEKESSLNAAALRSVGSG